MRKAYVVKIKVFKYVNVLLLFVGYNYDCKYKLVIPLLLEIVITKALMKQYNNIIYIYFKKHELLVFFQKAFNLIKEG